MNAIELLKCDHKTVRNLLEKMEHTTDRATKTRLALISEMKEKLSMHEEMEEKIFYPAMYEQDKKKILEAYEEHHVADNIMKELESLDTQDERWIAKVTVLKEVLEHHIREEENEIFKEARSMLGKTQLGQLGEEMQNLKSQMKNEHQNELQNGLP